VVVSKESFVYLAYFGFYDELYVCATHKNVLRCFTV
jgi:hypothetical protein